MIEILLPFLFMSSILIILTTSPKRPSKEEAEKDIVNSLKDKI